MDIELLEASAIAGDVSAMLKLVTHFYNQQNYPGSLHWADQAAQAGDPNGLGYSVGLHNICMFNAQEQRAWEVLEEEAAIIRRYCTELLRLHEEESFRLYDKNLSEARQCLQNARYYGALATFYIKDADMREGLRLLEGTDAPRENFMRSLLRLELDEPDWSISEVVACVADETYVTTEKTHAEEGIYCIAVVLASQHHQIAGTPDRAVALLKERLAHVVHEDMANILRQELALYRKRLFGGWKYTGS